MFTYSASKKLPRIIKDPKRPMAVRPSEEIHSGIFGTR